jgi:hypothetical protein
MSFQSFEEVENERLRDIEFIERILAPEAVSADLDCCYRTQRNQGSVGIFKKRNDLPRTP